MNEATIAAIVNQIIGISMGVIICAWFVGATSEQVAAIRFPATIVLTIYCVAALVRWLYPLNRENT